MQPEGGPTLTPAVNANLWEQGVSTRLVLFRDWTWQGTKSTSVFLAGLQKLDGKTTPGELDQVSAFKIGPVSLQAPFIREAANTDVWLKDGIASVPHDDEYHRSAEVPNVAQPKRKLGQTNFEIPDSEEDEDYGWANEDEAYLPPQPQQWQGSEDLLLGHDVGQSDDENDSEDDKRRTTDDPHTQD